MTKAIICPNCHKAWDCTAKQGIMCGRVDFQIRNGGIVIYEYVSCEMLSLILSKTEREVKGVISRQCFEL